MKNFDEDEKCLLAEKQKRFYLFKCPFWKMITLLDFEKMVTEGAIVSFKRRHYVIKLRRQIKVEKLKFEKTEERKKSFHRIS